MAKTESAYLFADIVKVEKADDGKSRVLDVRYADETKDLDGHRADYDWLKSALPDWFKYGNVRDMHHGGVVGKGTELTDNPGARAFDGVIKVVDPIAVMKIDEELYKGVSVGIKNVPGNQIRFIKEADGTKRIVGGAIVEVSLVDRPSNPNARLVLAKSAGGTDMAMLESPEVIETPPDPLEKAAAIDEVFEAAAADVAAKAEPDLTKGAFCACCDDCSAACDGTCCDDCTMMGGDEAMHNAPFQAAISALQRLTVQEASEAQPEFDDVAWLAGIGQQLASFSNHENNEYSKAASAYMLASPIGGLLQAAAEPDLIKSRIFYSREHRSQVEQAMRNLTALVQGDMQGGPAIDTAPGGSDAVVPTGGNDILNTSELTRDGDQRVRTPDSVAQQGPVTEGNPVNAPDTQTAPAAQTVTRSATAVADAPTTSSPTGVAQAGPAGILDGRVSVAKNQDIPNLPTGQHVSAVDPITGARAAVAATVLPNPITGGTNTIAAGAEADLTLGADADLTKSVQADLFKALLPDLLKDAVIADLIKEAMSEHFAGKGLEDTVEELGARARPGWQPNRNGADGLIVAEKQITLNKSVQADVDPELLERFARLQRLATDDNRETADLGKAAVAKFKTEHADLFT
jgi:hypothetical protein